jgi:hypothetical protein
LAKLAVYSFSASPSQFQNANSNKNPIREIRIIGEISGLFFSASSSQFQNANSNKNPIREIKTIGEIGGSLPNHKKTNRLGQHHPAGLSFIGYGG